MPEEKSKKTVDIDTSGPGAEVDVAEEKVKEDAVVEIEESKTDQEPEAKVEETETVKEIKKEQKKDDEQLEEYSKGVQSRISKLTRKMREAERQRDAATEYARAADESRKTLEQRVVKTDSDYIKKFESSVKEGMDSAQKELARAIESGDAKAQVDANKRIATLAFDNARLEQSKEMREETPAKPADVREPRQPSSQFSASDPQADAWASRNTWFGQNRAMTFTAFEIHKDLVDKEGFDPKSDEYYAEVDKRIRVDFPHKFGTSDNKYTTEPVQTVASAKRSVKPGRKTVRLTSSQVAIAKKLGVPLEDYAKQLKNTKGVV
jgi:hypothetical protein